jgi:predicted dienelactone hydrolase
MRRLIAVLIGLTLFVLAGQSAARADGFEAGIATLGLTDPVEGGPIPAIVVFPAVSGGDGPTDVGPFEVQAGFGAATAPGPFPLIVFSHGTGGSDLGHHDSMTALARAGFVAASVEHPRDNYRDDSAFGTDVQLSGRPHHIVALIDAILANPTFGPLIDRGRIGMAGHSAGGFTALEIAGAIPNVALSSAYQEAVPNDPLQQRADAAKPFRRRPDLQPISDPRVRAIFLMAPAIGYLLDRASLANVRVPVRLYRAGADEILINPWHAERIAQLLPVRPEYVVFAGAGHFVFLAPCTAALATIAPPICTDPPGIDRAAIHARLNAEMIDFFRRSLGVK